jgi:hypothetical protein
MNVKTLSKVALVALAVAAVSPKEQGFYASGSNLTFEYTPDITDPWANGAGSVAPSSGGFSGMFTNIFNFFSSGFVNIGNFFNNIGGSLFDRSDDQGQLPTGNPYDIKDHSNVGGGSGGGGDPASVMKGDETDILVSTADKEVGVVPDLLGSCELNPEHGYCENPGPIGTVTVIDNHETHCSLYPNDYGCAADDQDY